MSFIDLSKPEGLQAFDEYIASKSFVQGYLPTSLDLQVLALIGKAPAAKYTHALRYFNHMSSFTEEEKKQFRAGGDVPQQLAGSVKGPAVSSAAAPAAPAASKSGKKGKSQPAAAPAAAPAASPAASSADVAELEKKIAAQGDVVRKMKSEKASKDELKPEIDKLLALKAELQAAGGQPAAAPAQQDNSKKDKKDKKNKKNKDKKEEGGKKDGKKDEGKKQDAKIDGYDAKVWKAADKEGGKKGQDILGVHEMGGLEFFCTTIDTPDGDLGLMEVVLNGMNKEIDPASEEKRGGSSMVGKMLFSAGVDQLGMIARVPQDKTSKINTTEWMKHVCQSIGGELQPGGTVDFAKGVAKADKTKGRFPIKMKDDAISAAVTYLKERDCFPDQEEDDDDDIVYGDDDFDDAFA